MRWENRGRAVKEESGRRAVLAVLTNNRHGHTRTLSSPEKMNGMEGHKIVTAPTLTNLNNNNTPKPRATTNNTNNNGWRMNESTSDCI